MTWIGLLLAGLATTDLLRSVIPGRVPAWVGGLVALLLLTLLTGAHGALALVTLLVGAVVVVAWDRCVALADSRPGPWAAAPALLVLGGGLLLALVAAPWSPTADGLLSEWLQRSPWSSLASLDPDRAVLLLGVVLAQLSTGNVLVRLVLAVTDTVAPRLAHTADDPAEQLRGGRLLGPMERLVIVGLGLAGQLTAASIVIAAKGLLRWPELQSRVDQHQVHRLTEYFLVGSFVSWLVALGGLVLAH